MRWLKLLLCLVASTVVFILSTSLTIRFLLTDVDTIACPDVTGLDVEEAKSLADRMGLSLLIMRYEVRKDTAYNQVIAQKPDPATPVRLGRTVSVVLSDGPKPVDVPLLLGLTVEAAQAQIESNGLTLKKVIYVPNENVGKVLAQAPSSGTNIVDQEGVVLIAGGQERRFFMMPDMAAGDLGAILREMEEKHIRYSFAAAYPDVSLTPKSRFRPRAIFNDESVVELPAQ
jgi:beta-lactam-binding protein with PASTA domain